MKLINTFVIVMLLFPLMLFAQADNIIIDADTDHEHDDVLAISAAFESEKLNIIGLTSAQ